MAWTPVLPEALPNTPATADAALMPLTHLAVLEASGADATAFLHAQLSNDVQGLPADRSLLAGYCNAKGRLYAVPRLWRMAGGWRLALPADTADAVLKRLRMFVLRSQVTLHRREDVSLLGVARPRPADCLRQAGLPVPGEVDTVVARGETSVLRLPAPIERLALCVPDGEAPRLWAALASRATAAPAAAWRLLDIDAGLPAIYAATLESFVPQMVNLERVGGVSFRKGCYPGQEIVARMHYLGKPSRRMYRLQAPGVAPDPGSAVLDASAQEVGTVVDAAAVAPAGCRLLAVLQVTAAEDGLRLPDGRPLERLPLPYALEDAAEIAG